MEERQVDWDELQELVRSAEGGFRHVLTFGTMPVEQEIFHRDHFAKHMLMVFNAKGHHPNLYDAIQHLTCIIQRLREPSQKRAEYLGWLCSAKTSAFDLRKDEWILNAAVDHGRQARDEGDPADTEFIGEINHHLGCALILRASVLDTHSNDLDESIDCAREALRLLDPDHNIHQCTQGNLPGRLIKRYERTHTEDDLKEAEALVGRLMRESPSASTQYAQAIIHRGEISHQRYLHNQKLEDIDNAIHDLEQGVALMPTVGLAEINVFRNIRQFYHRRYKQTELLSDLECAISHSKFIVENVPRGSAIRLENLDITLRLLRDFCWFASDSDISNTLNIASDYWSQIPQNCPQRVSACRYFGDMLAMQYIGTTELRFLVTAVYQVVALISEYRAVDGKGSYWADINKFQNLHAYLRILAKADEEHAKKGVLISKVYGCFTQAYQSRELLEALSSISAQLEDDFIVIAGQDGTKTGRNMGAPKAGMSIMGESIMSVVDEKWTKRTGVRQMDPVLVERRLAFTRDAIFSNIFDYNGLTEIPKDEQSFIAMEARLECEAWEQDKRNGEHPSPDLCRVCRKLKLLVVDADGNTSWCTKSSELFGDYFQLRCRQHCGICRLVLSMITTTDGKSLHPRLGRINGEMQGVALRPRKFAGIGVELEVSYGTVSVGTLQLTEANDHELAKARLEMFITLSSDSFSGPPGPQREHWLSGGHDIDIDFLMLRRMIWNCHHNHDASCHVATHEIATGISGSSIEIILIDVMNKCLVHSTTQEHYFAISYVWGPVDVPKTYKSNLTERLAKNSLALLALPRTVRDALHAVRVLGGRYLWTDALCIVQDDLQHQTQSIKQMHVIFGAAFCTIAAVHGVDVDGGLPGFLSARAPRSSEKIRLSCSASPSCPEENTFLNEVTAEIATSGPPLEHRLATAIWNERGWILQEQMLSRRIVYVSTNHVYFQCARGIWCETDTPSTAATSTTQIIAPQIPSKSHPFFNWRTGIAASLTKYQLGTFEAYSHLVEMYTSRRLTYRFDILNAFTGILSVLDMYFLSDNVCGLPASALDLGLLWTPVKSVSRLAQVESSDSNEKDAPASRISFPSWSWAGWEGSVEYIVPIMSNTFGGQLPTPMIEDVRYHHKNHARVIRIRTLDGSYKSGDESSIDDPIKPDRAELDRLEISCDREETNLLEFHAETSDAMQFQRPELMRRHRLREKSNGYSDSGHSVSELRDKHGNHCGIWHNVSDTKEDASASGGSKSVRQGRQRSKSLPSVNKSDCELVRRRSFVAISRYEPADTSDEELRGPYQYQGEISLFDTTVFPATGPQSGLVNILVVDWDGGSAKRVTVAQVHAEAWRMAQPKRKLIRLV